MNSDQNPTVYSTEFGRICSKCGQPINACKCKKQEKSDPKKKSDGVVRLFLERKGRGGKTVTIIDGIPISPEELKTLLKSLKHQCGSGGSVKDGKIEIQGDVRDLILPTLQKMGFNAKKAGG